MPGLDPGIHETLTAVPLCVDGQDKPSHDEYAIASLRLQGQAFPYAVTLPGGKPLTQGSRPSKPRSERL